MKTVLVIGASEKVDRYSNKAVKMLIEKGFPVVAFGQRAGKIDAIEIVTDWSVINHIDTVTLYINPSLQEKYYQAIIELKPRRVLFNPGTENRAFVKMLEEVGIETEEACTLVLLSTGVF
ncbi:MAG: CoA-binding protein [Bacteroidota bacterium]